MKKLWLTLIFVLGVFALVVAEAATVFSLPETWGSFTHLVSRLTKPLPPSQVSAFGIAILVVGFLLLLVGIVMAYSQIRKSGPDEDGPEAPDLTKLGLSPQQESVVLPLVERKADEAKGKPRRLALIVAMAMVAVGVAMVLQGSHELERHGARIAIADNQVVAGPARARGPQGRMGKTEPAKDATGGRQGHQEVLGASTGEGLGEESGGEAFKSSECGCSGLPPVEGGGTTESQLPPEEEQAPVEEGSEEEAPVVEEVEPEEEEVEPEEVEPEEPEIE